MAQLKICKHCGSVAVYERKNFKLSEYENRSEHVIHCDQCDYKTKKHPNSLEAIKEWNSKRERA